MKEVTRMFRKQVRSGLYWGFTIVVLLYGLSHLLLTEFAAPIWVTPRRSLFALAWMVFFLFREMVKHRACFVPPEEE